MTKTKNSWRDELGIVELIEQSISLVRSTLSAYGWIYYLSTIPFIIAFIYFWSIMSSKLIMPFEISSFSLLLTLLFWIKVTGQSIYCKQLLSLLIDEKPNKKLKSFSNIAVNSIFIHPIAIIILLISFIIFFPAGYAIISSQYLFIASTEKDTGIVKTIKTSYKFAVQESIYQHLVLIFLVGLFIIIFFNVITILFFLPHMLKSFLNIDTVFTQATFSIFNTTFIIIAACTSYLIFDPIFKAFYVNLYFHIKSRSSGQDIMAECRRLSHKRGLKRAFINTILVFALFFSSSNSIHANDETNKINNPKQQDLMEVEDSDINQLAKAISEVSKGNLYRWRYKNKKNKKEKKGLIFQMIEDLRKTLGKWLKPLGKFIRKIVKRIDDFIRKLIFSEKGSADKPTESFWADLWPKIIILITVFIFLLGVIYLFWLHHKDKITVVRTPKRKIPDIMEEDLDATELKEDEWLKMGEELMARGELTLALRSIFLAILSFFHRNSYLVFERSKTNYNYLSEIAGNSDNNAHLLDSFRACIEIFERSWYGRYPVTMDILERFKAYQHGIMGNKRA